MPALLVLVLTWFSRYLIIQIFKYVFTGFLGLVSYGFMQALINRYINAFLSEILSTDISPIINISRLDDFISVIVGALTIKTAIKAMGVKLIPFT